MSLSDIALIKITKSKDKGEGIIREYPTLLSLCVFMSCVG
jgi:hypothetical protein